jgi:hypothetical protein
MHAIIFTLGLDGPISKGMQVRWLHKKHPVSPTSKFVKQLSVIYTQ